jgi:hypothetical protein
MVKKERGANTVGGKSNKEQGLHENLALADFFVTLDFAVAEADDAVGVLGDVRFVGDEDDGVAAFVQPGEEGHNFLASLRV